MMMQRGDFTVLHEPFSHVADFGEALIGDRTVLTESELINAVRDLARQVPVFFKDTTDFRYPSLLADTAFLREATHLFMIRHPRAAIASHYRLNPHLRCDEIGFGWLYEIFAAVQAATRACPVVIDGDDLAAEPAALVRACCSQIGIPYRPDALHWRPGLDQQWRRTARWHTSVSASSGFEWPDPAPVRDLDPVLNEYLRYHQPYYEKMHAVRLRP
jgi:hypothetical protein